MITLGAAYNDPALDLAYSRIVKGVTSLKIPVYGQVFSKDQAGVLADNLLQAVLALPDSPALQQKIRAAATSPAVIAKIKAAAGEGAKDQTVPAVAGLLVGAGLITSVFLLFGVARHA